MNILRIVRCSVEPVWLLEKGHVCAANNHRQQKAACSEPRPSAETNKQREFYLWTPPVEGHTKPRPKLPIHLTPHSVDKTPHQRPKAPLSITSLLTQEELQFQIYCGHDGLEFKFQTSKIQDIKTKPGMKPMSFPLLNLSLCILRPCFSQWFHLSRYCPIAILATVPFLQFEAPSLEEANSKCSRFFSCISWFNILSR